MFRKIWAMLCLKVGRDLGEAVTLSAWENVISNQAVVTAGRPQGLWPPLGRTILYSVSRPRSPRDLSGFSASHQTLCQPSFGRGADYIWSPDNLV